MNTFQNAGIIGKYYASFLNFYLVRMYFSRRKKNQDTRTHMDAAVQWICRAQDASGSGGVCRSYSLVFNPYFRRKGWVPAYPETTGYIIPTLFDYAHLTRREDIFDRAVRMTDWECTVQMESGAVQGGTIDRPPTPAIFNTGQVIFGWLRAYTETGNERYLQSAIRAGTYLVDHQSPDGAWRKNLSQYASDNMPFYTYNTRTAWGLLLLSRVTGNRVFKQAAVGNIDFALEQQLENGWFRSNCLTDPSQPLLHTIAYCIRGVLETGIALENRGYIEKAKKAADALMARQRRDGGLAGRFDHHWHPTVSWSCLTGVAQISGIWGRLYQHTDDARYLDCMKKANAYLRRVQMIDTQHPALYGGIAGSDPLHGGYGTFEVLNWAVKFFLDALMLELFLESRSENTIPEKRRSHEGSTSRSTGQESRQG